MKSPYGIMAAFATRESFLAGLDWVREAGFTRVETYMPYPVEGAAVLPPKKRSPVPAAMAIGGLLSGLGAFFMQWYAARIYPIDVGGRPLNSWPAFVPITFELTVLGASLVGMVAFFIVAGFPRLEHPVFNDRRFYRASQDRFFLCIRHDDPRLAATPPAHLRASLHAESIEEVFR